MTPIDPQPGEGGYAVMPSAPRLHSGSLPDIIGRGGVVENQKSWWIEAFLSPDEDRSWYMLDRPRVNNHGNPPHMIRLRDGRIVLTHGWRAPPHGSRTMLTSDEGTTWSDEIIRRDDGKSWDPGYPRTVQRSDRRIVTVYYFNVPGSKERHIAATIWNPGPAPAPDQAGQVC